MTFRVLVPAAALAAFCSFHVPSAAAAIAPAERCEIGKLKTVATYASCRLKAEAKGIAKGLSPDYSRCETKINTKFPRYEEKAGVGICPSEGDLADIRDRGDVFTTEVAVLLSGGVLPPTTCGDGAVGLGEECDVGNLDGEDCVSRGFGAGTLACGPGCTFDTSGCYADRFEDTGLTILDHDTGLEWEKKDSSDATANPANAHDVDNTYTWASGGSTSTQSGTVFTSFLAALNGTVDHPTTTTIGCFAGACDWRIPTVDELKSIADLSPCSGGAPCVQDALLLPARSGRYWTNSSRDGVPTGAYWVDFLNGTVAADFKTTAYFVRAVRTAN